MALIPPIVLSGLKQSDGAQIVAVPTRNTSWVMIDIETTSTQGSIAIYAQTPEMTGYKAFRDANGNAVSISASSPYPIFMTSIALDSIKLIPTGLDAGTTYNAVITMKGGD